MKRILRPLICAALFLIALGCAFYFSGPARDMRRIRQHMTELGTAPDLREIAAACATLLHAGSDSRLLTPPWTDESLPAAIRSKNPRWVSIDPLAGTVQIEFGGGFFHYGYRFEPVPSGSGKNRLLLYGEEEDEQREILRE